MQMDRRTFVGGAALFASAAGAAQAKTRKSGGGRAEGKALSRLEDYVERHCADYGLPGMTACVIDRNGFSGFVTSGLADVDKNIPVGPDHLFQIGSITKMMTALAAWSLIDEGKLSPDARLSDLMPELSVHGGDEIILQHLLNHVSGLPRGAPLLVDGGLWVGAKPGTHWAYSNLGYRIVGRIVARTDQRPFAECLQARVLKPLGMTNSLSALRAEDQPRYAQGYQPALMDRPAMRTGPRVQSPWVDYDGSSGCIAATAADMAVFLRFLLGLADGKGGPVLSDSAAARFLADPSPAPGWAKGAHYGNGIARIENDGRAYLHHTGGMVSFSSSLHVDTEAGVAAFASANIHYAHNYRPRDVTLYACELLRAVHDGADAPAPKPTKPSVENPAQFAGVFTAESGDSFEIVAGAADVMMRRGGRDAKMQPIGKAYFACDDEAFKITGLQFDVEDGAAVRAWAGGVEYAADPAKGYLPPPPPQWRALEGFYESDDRWSLPIRIYARHDSLCMKQANYGSMLKHRGNGDWGFDEDETVAEWVRFDGVIDGKPQRLQISGAPYMRRFS